MWPLSNYTGSFFVVVVVGGGGRHGRRCWVGTRRVMRNLELSASAKRSFSDRDWLGSRIAKPYHLLKHNVDCLRPAHLQYVVHHTDSGTLPSAQGQTTHTRRYHCWAEEFTGFVTIHHVQDRIHRALSCPPPMQRGRTDYSFGTQ